MVGESPRQKRSPLVGIAIALVAFAVAGAVGYMIATAQKRSAAPIVLQQPVLLPVEVKFNQVLDRYTEGEAVEIYLKPGAPCYAYLFVADSAGRVMELYPGFQAGNPELLKRSKRVDQAKDIKSKVQQQLEADGKHDLSIVTVAFADDPKCAEFVKRHLVKDTEWASKDLGMLKIDDALLLGRIEEFKKSNPGLVIWHKFKLPKAKKG